MTTARPNEFAHLSEIQFAELLGVKSAGPGARSLAFLIDAIVWLALTIPAVIGVILLTTGTSRGWGIGLTIAGAVAPTIFGIIQLIVHGRRGVTLGKAATKLRSVSVSTLERPGFWRIVLRALVLWASTIVPLIGPVVMLASSLWGNRGRSLLDLVGKCWLVDTKSGIDPASEKDMRRAKRTLFAPKRDVSEHLPALTTGTSPADGPTPTRSSAGIVGAARAAWEQKSREPSSPRIVLVFDDGMTLPVPMVGILGRAPEAPAGRTGIDLLTLEDPARQLSKSHAAFGLDDGGIWIEDLRSSNGTTIATQTAGEVELEPGFRTRVAVGDVVRIGGRAFRVAHEGGPT